MYHFFNRECLIISNQLWQTLESLPKGVVQLFF